jgi:hypothetical protein
LTQPLPLPEAFKHFMSQPTVDLDSETILFEGQWYTRDDLARRIKGMLDAQDFAVARPSQALEALTTALQNVRTMAFRAPAELVEQVNAAAVSQGKSVGALLREAVAAYLRDSRDAFTPRTPMALQAALQSYGVPNPSAPQPPGVVPVMSVAELAPPLHPTQPMLIPLINAVSTPIAGPGALRAAGVDTGPSVVVNLEEERPVELTNPKRS